MAVFKPAKNQCYYTNFQVGGKRYVVNTGHAHKDKAEAFERNLRDQKRLEHRRARSEKHVAVTELEAIEQALRKATGRTLDLSQVTDAVSAIELVCQVQTGQRLDLRACQTTDDFIRLAHRIKRKQDLPRLPIQEAWSLYLQLPKRRRQSDQLQKRYSSYWTDFRAWLETEQPGFAYVDEIDQRTAELYMGSLDAKRLSVRTYNARLMLLRHVFTITGSHAGILENPFGAVSMQQLDTVSREDFSPKQLSAIEKAVADDTDMRRFLMILCHTGLRTGDAATLKWSECDLAEGQINRRLQKTNQLVNIPVLGGLRTELEAMRKEDKDATFLFPHFAELHARDSSALGKRFEKILVEAKIEGRKKVRGRRRQASIYDLHSFRHTFAAICGRHRVPIAVVQSILGHKDEKTTAIYQRHATKADRVAAVKTIPAGLFGGTDRRALPAGQRQRSRQQTRMERAE